MAPAASGSDAAFSGGRDFVRVGEWVTLFLALGMVGVGIWSLVWPTPDPPPRTSFTRVAGETRTETAAEAAELWRPSTVLGPVVAPVASDPATQWEAATCAVARSPVRPLRWGPSEEADVEKCPAEVETEAGWNVYETPTTRALGLPPWATQSDEVHRQVIVVSATGPVPALPAGKRDPGRPTPQAPDVAVATVLAAHLAEDLGQKTTVIVVPRYAESDRELLAALRRDGNAIEEGILIGGPRRVSEGARELVRQLTTSTPPKTFVERVTQAYGPVQELVAAVVALLGVATAARTGSVLLAGKDGSGGSGVRSFLGGLLGGARFEQVVEARRAAAGRRNAAAVETDPRYLPLIQDGEDPAGGGSVTRNAPPEGTSTVRITPSAQPQDPTPPPDREVVELRVHGVHGTSPAAMLGVADGKVGRVAGDDLTGVYRIEDGDPPLRRLALETGENRPPVSVEAYSWGALTSGVQGFLGWVRRSLWLLLLPFALVNLAFWARTELDRSSREQRLGAWAVRAAGLLLTVFFVLTPCLLFLDLVAWQCFRHGVPSCEPLPGWTDGLAGLTAGQRIAVASLAPMATLLGLWLLSRTTVTRYEDVGPVATPTRADLERTGPGRVLRHPRLWRGRDRTRMLARRHLAAGVTTVALFMAQHLIDAGRLATWQWWLVLAVVLLGWSTLLFCLVAVLGPHADDIDAPPLDEDDAVDHRARAVRRDTVVVVLSLVTYAVTVLLLVVPGLGGGSMDEDSAWFGRSFWFIAVFVAVTLLHLAVFTGGRMPLPLAIGIVLLALTGFGVLVALQRVGAYGADDLAAVLVAGLAAGAVAVLLGVWHYRLGSGESSRAKAVRSRAWNGAGASVLLAAGAWVALLFTSATVVATADWLNGSEHGVGDLVSSTKVETDDYQDRRSPVQRTDARPAYVATGDVVLHRARVVRTDDGLVVTSGEVEADDVWRDVRPGATAKRFGRTTVGATSVLRLPGGTVELDYACVDRRPTTATCSAEDIAFRGAGRIRVAADGDEGTITLAPGVVVAPATSPQTPLAVPPVLLWMPVAQVLWVLLVGLVLGAAYATFRRGAGRQVVFPDDPRPPDDAVPGRDRARCLQARRRAAFGHRAERLLDLVGLVTSVVALPLVALSLTGGAPWQNARLGWTRGWADVGMYLVVGLSALLVGLGSRMRRSESTRKAVGVLWDLTTFWPRAAHPLAPPCYAERVVPELVQRSRWVLERGPRNELVLSGHSQGSLIVVATASRLTDAELGRTHLVTYGSQVRALYGRVFPAVLGPDDVGYAPTEGVTRLRDGFPDVPRADPPPVAPLDPDSLRGRLRRKGGSWVNLFRRTDPLGYRVFGDVDGPPGTDWGASYDLPVMEVPPDAAGDPGPRVMGHGGYQHTLAYRRVVATWTGETVVEDVTGTAGVPTHPPG